MNRPLKQVVHEHFERRVLSTDKIERLEALMAANEPRPVRRRRVPRPVPGWSLATVIAVLLVLIVLHPPSLVDDIPMTERIAAEVALNHIKLKPLDIETDNMDSLRRYFSDLEFVPVESRLLTSANLELLGGRYCSIQSVPAAQLRIASRDSRRLRTLYQTEYRKDLFGPLPVLENGEAPVDINVKGIAVRLWTEKGLLFAMTDASEPESIDPPE